MILDNFKKLNKPILVKKNKKQYQQTAIPLFTMLKTLIFVTIYEAKFGKESTMDEELDICNRVYEIAIYFMSGVCVTIKKYTENKPPYIQIRLFTAKENDAMKQVGYVQYTLNEFKELSQILGDLMIVDNCKPQ